MPPPLLLQVALATRPWSLTASLLPTLVTLCVVADRIVVPATSICGLVAAVLLLHLAGNLFNTYFDFASGADTPAAADDRTLVDDVLSPSTVAASAAVCLLGGGTLGAWLCAHLTAHALAIPLAGVLLALLYTASPFSLKHHGLGDVTIFACFGPLLAAGVSVVATHSDSIIPDAAVATMSIALGLLTVNILHANNARDADADAAVGGRTVANMLGFEASYTLFLVYFGVAYATAIMGLGVVLGGSHSADFSRVWGAWLPRLLGASAAAPAGFVSVGAVVAWAAATLLLFSAPPCLQLAASFHGRHLATLPQEVAQFGVLFGAVLLTTMVVGAGFLLAASSEGGGGGAK